MNDFQFEILPSVDAEDGVVFGIGADVSLNQDGFHPGSTDWATQDVDSGATGHTNFGRDLLLGPSWSWDLHVNRDDCEEALESLGAFTTAWRALDVRGPSEVTALRYQLVGRRRRIYGRPRRCEASPNNLILSGYTDVGVDFKAVDGFTYDDEQTGITLLLAGNEDGPAGGGLRFPARLPVDTDPTTVQQAQIVVGGDAPTYPIIRFTGPVTGPSLSTDSWVISLPEYEIPTGSFVEIDTRPWVSTVMLNGESSIAGEIGRRQNLPASRLKPGALEVSFHGASSDGTATCEVRWASAWNSI